MTLLVLTQLEREDLLSDRLLDIFSWILLFVEMQNGVRMICFSSFSTKFLFFFCGITLTDVGVDEGCQIYSRRMHNICCDNCHCHVACCLNRRGYGRLINNTKCNNISFNFLSNFRGISKLWHVIDWSMVLFQRLVH